MHVPRTALTRTRRIGVGIAAAAVVTAGLACLGPAQAAELDDFPHAVDFTPTDLVATGDELYAVGYVGVDLDGDYQFDQLDGFVEAAGSGEKVSLGSGAWPSAVSASPDGSTLHVIGSRTDPELPENGASGHRWTIDTATMTVTASAGLGPGNAFDVASDATDTYVTTSLNDSAALLRLGGTEVSLGDAISPERLGLLPDGQSSQVVVAGSDYVGQGTQATLRIVDGDVVGPKVVLGPDGGADEGVTGMDVDEANGLLYVTTFRNVEDGPQEYGLNVIGPDTDLYVPIDHPVFSVAVSPDGGTVYLPGTGVSAYDVDRLASYTEDDPAPAASLGGSGWVSLATVDPAGRLYAAMDHDVTDPDTGETLSTTTKLHALEAPPAPTGLTATTSEWDPRTLAASWTAAAGTGGATEDSVTYRVSLQDQAGGEPVTTETFLTDTEFGDLLPGHTYTLSVATTNGAFTSAPATTTWTAPTAVAAPSAVAVSGSLSVGSRLSVRTTGTWPADTTLSYEWRNNAGQLLGRSSTLTISAAQAGRRIRVAVTGEMDGAVPATVTSAYSTTVALGTLASRVPAISGTAKVGRTLSVTPGAWTTGTRFTYRWTANGRTIRGATARTYRPTRAVAGKRIRVVVTGSKTGYRTLSRTSAPTGVVKR